MKKLILVALILTFLGGSAIASFSRTNLTEMVALENLKPNSLYDWEHVVVEGWVRTVEVGQGTRGSHYLHLTIGEGDQTLEVYQYPVPVLGDILGQRVVIRGVYMPRGRFGGFLRFGDFLIADIIVRDWDYKGDSK